MQTTSDTESMYRSLIVMYPLQPRTIRTWWAIREPPASEHGRPDYSNQIVSRYGRNQK